MSRELEVVRVDELPPSDVLVVALSRLGREHTTDRDRALNAAIRANTDDDADALFNYANTPTHMFPWQQALRALAWHTQHSRGRPPDLVVATSNESAIDFDDFGRIVEGFTRPILTSCGEADRQFLSTWGEPADFEEFDTVTSRLRRLMRERREKGARNICIDITGGQKTFSAAATVVTVNEDTVISYVRTETAPAHGVLIYDVRDGGVDETEIAGV